VRGRCPFLIGRPMGGASVASIMDSGTVALVKATPFLIPFLGLAGFVILFSILLLFLWIVAVVVMTPIRAPAADPGNGTDQTASGNGAGNTSTIVIVQAYIPGFGLLMGSYTIVLQQFAGIFTSLQAFATAEFLQFIFAALMASASIALLQFGGQFATELYTIYQCNVLPLINPVLLLANLANFLLGIVWPSVTFYFSWMFGTSLFLFIRVMAVCTAANFESILTKLVFDIGVFLELLFSAIFNFIGDQSALVSDEVDLVPAFSQLGVVISDVSIVLNCSCQYLSFERLSTHTWFELIYHIGVGRPL